MTAQTSNGKTATFRLDGKEYDLAGGTLFVVKFKDGTNEVHQLKRDLSAIPFEGDECREALAKDAEITKLMGIEPAK